MSKWISTKKKKPTEKEVLLYDAETGLYAVGYYNKDFKEWDWNDGWNTSRDPDCWTHWTIPDPPQTEKTK